MAWSEAARKSSIASRRARKGSGTTGALSGLMKGTKMPATTRKAMNNALKTIRAHRKGLG